MYIPKTDKCRKKKIKELNEELRWRVSLSKDIECDIKFWSSVIPNVDNPLIKKHYTGTCNYLSNRGAMNIIRIEFIEQALLKLTKNGKENNQEKGREWGEEKANWDRAHAKWKARHKAGIRAAAQSRG